MTTATLTITGPDFTSALDAVRFAVSVDPDPPALRGVLLDVADGSVTLVATDRDRLAVASLLSSVDGPDQAVVVPAGWGRSTAPSSAET